MDEIGETITQSTILGIAIGIAGGLLAYVVTNDSGIAVCVGWLSYLITYHSLVKL